RFHFDASKTGYFFAVFGVLAAIVQGAMIRPIVKRLGDKPTFVAGLLCSVAGLIVATLAHSVTMFAWTLVPLAFGIGFGHPTLAAQARPGRSAGATVGPAGRQITKLAPRRGSLTTVMYPPLCFAMP